MSFRLAAEEKVDGGDTGGHADGPEGGVYKYFSGFSCLSDAK